MKEELKLDSLLNVDIKKERLSGETARESCMVAATLIAKSFSSQLGPKGLFKLLSEEARPLFISRDAHSLITGLMLEHPAAKLMVELLDAQDREVGDGNTSTIILAGELISRANTLIDEGLSPITIIEGYRMAAERAEEILNELAAPIPRDDLIKVVNTSLKDYKGDWISKKIVEMVSGIKEQFGEVDLDRIAIHAIEGGGIDDSFVVKGSTLFGWALPSSKKRVEGAKIAILEKPLEINMGEMVSGMRFKDSKELSRCFHEEEELLRAMVNRLIHVGANVVISMGSIDVRGAKFVNDIFSISPDDLGEAELVEERRMAEEDMIIIDGCKNGSSTLIVRGGSKQLADEYKRIVHTAISSLAKTLDDMRAVPGGGAIEIELAKQIRAWAVTVRSKRQFAIEAFARSLETIPKALATNAGLDQVEILTELRRLHEKNPAMGLYIAEDLAYIDDTLKHGVIDPFVVKRQMIHGALEAAELIILVDGILQDKSRESKTHGGRTLGRMIQGYPGAEVILYDLYGADKGSRIPDFDLCVSPVHSPQDR